MELHHGQSEYGRMLGKIRFYGCEAIEMDFHGPLCLARYAERVNRGLFGVAPFRLVTDERAEANGHP